jgi:Uncharacterized conserved protein (COG2071)
MKQKSIFLTAEWNNRLMLNYAVDASLLQRFIPAGRELDVFEGRTYPGRLRFQPLAIIRFIGSVSTNGSKRSTFGFMRADCKRGEVPRANSSLNITGRHTPGDRAELETFDNWNTF